MKHFYVTTPIYYVNDRPHVGHAYSSVAADVLKRYRGLRGDACYALTGTDEHGQKIERRAKEAALSPQQFVDQMSPPFRQTADMLLCQYNDFIRTTEPRHVACAQRLWERLEAAGDIYLGEYEGWYSVSSEAFLSEKDLLAGNLDPVTKKPVERVREKSYFFRLSKYTQPLLEYYEKYPNFIQPKARRNEVIAFVKEGLHDLSISRSTFRWGIPVPKDPEHVMYVWLDALTNYISALGAFEPTPDGQDTLFTKFWPPQGRVVHLVGKDILRFHAVYWPAFLLSAKIECPTQVWAHGWLTVDGEKMSKSLGNFVPPGPLVEMFGADVVRYYLMRDVAFGQDGDFSHRNLIGRYQAELANGLGNLLQRTVGSLLQKAFDGKIPQVDGKQLQSVDQQLIEESQKVASLAGSYFDEIAPHRALESIWGLVNAANKYVDATAPWALLKEGNSARLAQVLYTAAECLRWLSIMLWPVMPKKADALRHTLGLEPLLPTETLDRWPSAWGALKKDQQTRPGSALFPRFDAQREQAILEHLGLTKSKGPAVTTPQTTEIEQKSSPIAIDDFAKVDLRLGLVKSAERVPKSDKLLRLMVDLDESEPRQILAGIGKTYTPEDIIGKRLVVIANLAPRKMMGFESHGMVLAVSDDEGLSVLTVDKPIAAGRRVS